MLKTRSVVRKFSLQKADARLGIIFILPSLLLIASVIIYPIFFNVYLSFHRVSINPLRPHRFVALDNYFKLFRDGQFLTSLGTTVVYVACTVISSTIVGLLVALLLNRRFRGRKAVRSLIILPYVAPVISLVFVWQYMFNGIYGIVNYLAVDVFHRFEVPPAWFDHPVLSLFLVVLFDTWRVFPYAFMMILASLQAIDDSLYEAAGMDGANGWQQFFVITLPELMPALSSIIILRSIWNFYKFDDVYLLTKQVPIMGVYLYETAFAVNDYGLAASITVVLFAIVMSFVFFMRRRMHQE